MVRSSKFETYSKIFFPISGDQEKIIHVPELQYLSQKPKALSLLLPPLRLC